MQNTAGKKIKLGIFVAAAIILFVIGIYFIGARQQLFTNTFPLNAVFKDISGLQVGNNVRFSGINVGVVSDIEQVTDTSVKVEMDIEESTRKFIKANAKAEISSDGLMGNKIISIIPGKPGAPVVKDDYTLASVIPVNIDDILSKIKSTSDNAASISGDLATITHNIRAGKGTIGKLFMDTTLANNLDQTVVNIKQGAGGFNQNMKAVQHNFLLRGYFNKKAKKEKEKEEKAKEKAEGK